MIKLKVEEMKARHKKIDRSLLDLDYKPIGKNAAADKGKNYWNVALVILLIALISWLLSN